MLEGITVLNREMIMVGPDWVGRFIAIMFSITVISVILFVSCLSTDHGIGAIVSIVLTVTSLIILSVVASIQPRVESGRYRYEVIIDESVPLVDIYENYKIVEQRGEIWVLEDKTEQ